MVSSLLKAARKAAKEAKDLRKQTDNILNKKEKTSNPFSSIKKFPKLSKEEESLVASSSAPIEEIAGLGRVKTEKINTKDILEKENPNFKYHKLKKYYPNKTQKEGCCNQVGEADLKGYDIIKRVYDIDGKAPALTTMQGGHREPKIACPDKIHWRKLTLLEMERLQTLPDGYTDKGVSNTQRYKMLGNGFTVDVIAHILKGILYDDSIIKAYHNWGMHG